ncbi:MAG: outer membrane protein transport protein [Micavibrio aeruginosavorus]|nr:outer membrane protein transport protein [Micavibrio aeruginosavorus]
MMQRALSFGLGLFSAAALIGLAPEVRAAGFYIQESSISGFGYAFSGSTTNALDASTVFFNPAGMTQLEKGQMTFGVSLLAPESTLTNTGSTFDANGPGAGGVGAVGGDDGGNPYAPTPVPTLSVAYPLDDRVWAGLSVNAPFGLANDYGDDWFGRYDSTKTDLTTVNIAPAFAVRLSDQIAVGAGIDIQYAKAELKSAASNFASFGESVLKGKDWSCGMNAGVQITPAPGTVIGAHYRTAMHHTLDGRVILQGLNAGNIDAAAKADLDLPDIATLGIAQNVGGRLKLLGQATWYGWSQFETIAPVRDDGVAVTATEQNYNNTLAFSVGAEYKASDSWTLRTGFQYDPTPTVDEFRTSRTPDGDRMWVTGGASYAWSDRLTLDMAAGYIDIAGETINVTRNSGFATVRANTEGHVGIAALGLTWKF